MNLAPDEKAYLAAWLKEESLRFNYGPAHDLARENGAKYDDIASITAAYLTPPEQFAIAERPASKSVKWPWTPATFTRRLREAEHVLRKRNMASAGQREDHTS
jgi:hypothetical protein